MPCASLPRHEGDGGKEIPAKTLILFFKNKKKPQHRQNFLKTASYLIISQKLAWKRHLLCPCSRTCSGLCPSPLPPAPRHRRCQPIVPRGSAPHPGRPQWRVPVGTPRPLFASVAAPQVPGRAAGGLGSPGGLITHLLLTPVATGTPQKGSALQPGTGTRCWERGGCKRCSKGAAPLFCRRHHQPGTAPPGPTGSGDQPRGFAPPAAGCPLSRH